MLIVGVDYHPSFQTIAFLMEETGECGEQELNHRDGEAERFYRELQQRGVLRAGGLGGHRIFTLIQRRGCSSQKVSSTTT
jgi:hypothetical protein